MLKLKFETCHIKSSSIAKSEKGMNMERHDMDIVDLDPRAIIRLNSIVELKFFIMALIYQHKNREVNDSEV